jgi:hypothetical protein
MHAISRTQLASANTLYRAGRFPEAEHQYRQMVEQDRENPTVLTRLGEIALWKNEAHTAEAYLKAAALHCPPLQKIWPFSTEIHSLLAQCYYRQDRFQQASEHFQKAAGPLPWGPFRDLKALGAQMALLDGHTPYQVEGPKQALIPFVLTDPLPLIEVSVNGAQPALFFIDTGGAEVIIDTGLAEQVRAVQSGRLRGAGGGTQGSTSLGKVDMIGMGDIHVQQIPVHVMDTSHFRRVFDDLPVKGVIGTRLLMHFLATIDYPRGHLVLRHRHAAPEVGRKTAGVIPFWLIQTHYMVAQGSLNETTSGLFFIDTGLAGKGFTASDSMLRQAGIDVDWTKTETGVAAFGEAETVDIVADRLTLGTGSNAVTADHVLGVAFKKSFGILGDTLGVNIDGVVSHQFFRKHALTLDFAGMRLILHEGE